MSEKKDDMPKGEHRGFHMMGPRPGGPHHMMGHTPAKPKNVKGTLRRLLDYLSDKKIAIILVFMLTLSTTIINILTTRLNGVVIDNYVTKGDLRGLFIICLTLLFVYILNVVMTYFQNTLMLDISQKTSYVIRNDLFSCLQELPLKFFDTHSSGDLMSRLTNDVDNISMMLTQSVTQLFSGVISLVGTLVAMLLLSPLLTLVSLVAIPLMLLLTKSVAMVSRKYFKKQQTCLGNLNGFVEEIVSGQKVVKLYGREEYVKKDFEKINADLKKSGIIAQSVSGLMGPTMNMINNISYLIVTVFGAYLILKSTGVTVGIVFSFILYMRSFGRPLADLANLFNTIQSALAGAERVFEVMDEKKEEDKPGAIEKTDIKGDISFKDVTFSYIPGKPVLKHATIEAKRGQQIAIVGPTGAGKTTIISLLTRFYDIDSGSILIDGVNISEFSRRSIRRCVGMVLQDTYLFSETVRENIRYGRLDASDEEVERAAKMANAHSFIMHLPHGYDTVLSDNASNISQGQRQLLAIARAILADPYVLILDEATSAIDTRTELKIQQALLNLMKGRTSFIIAHRLSTIKNADKILVINGGEIVEEGTHNELLAKNGFYAYLYNSQFKTGLAL